jgi:hypothetical protein
MTVEKPFNVNALQALLRRYLPAADGAQSIPT